VAEFLHAALDESTSLADWFARLLARLFRDTPLVVHTTTLDASRRGAAEVIAAEIRAPGASTERVQEAGHGLSVDLPRGRVDVTTPQSFGKLHPGAAVPAGPLPRWYAMRIAVADVQAAAAHLKSQGIEASHLEDGGLRLQPADTCGVLMEFVAT